MGITKQYSEEVKKDIVSEIERRNLSISEAIAEYGSSKSNLRL